MKKFSPNDLLRYIYGETNVNETQDIQIALLHDNELFESYQEMAETINFINTAKKSAPESVINNILAYSKNHQINKVEK
ncbi:hypothetical protein [Aureibacter tunicatorum]|uniref:Uncharacterized protein n=1 Tax=Aureibacter tunicatorum TaxID=866807 RepID=A0AAE4BQG2_9BACT|nr:hypothetical protein [Aureibacter tunicatorum]MDR6237521.1 hypothetical protein [Aureibacter tunicatorum]BDD02555.1 hypothetical protein AUTU_00380 [Aureibacter tunicatorum]